MTVKIKCPVCGNLGALMQKTTKSKGYSYRKWYVYHNRSKGTKQRWCYLSKKYLDILEIKQAIEQLTGNQFTTQNTTQNINQTTQNTPITRQSKQHLENLNLEALYQNSRKYRARSSARKSLNSAHSIGLLTRWSGVQFPSGPPLFRFKSLNMASASIFSMSYA